MDDRMRMLKLRKEKGRRGGYAIFKENMAEISADLMEYMKHERKMRL